MKKIHLIMPMGGRGSRFSEIGMHEPKPLLELNGKPFFYWATQSIIKFIEVESLTFVVLQEHIDFFQIDKIIKNYYPYANIKVIKDVLPGAVLTCMEGIKHIDDDAPIIFNDCDHLFRCSLFEQFCGEADFEKLDGALLTFDSDENKYSFLEYDENGYVKRTVEKEVVSHHAICGSYFFRDKEVFLRATEKYLKECSYSEYFISGVYNVMAREGMKIVGFPTDYHIPFGVPDEYEAAKTTDKFGELLS